MVVEVGAVVVDFHVLRAAELRKVRCDSLVLCCTAMCVFVDQIGGLAGLISETTYWQKLALFASGFNAPTLRISMLHPN